MEQITALINISCETEILETFENKVPNQYESSENFLIFSTWLITVNSTDIIIVIIMLIAIADPAFFNNIETMKKSEEKAKITTACTHKISHKFVEMPV